jgi:hypothetical protein
MNWKKSVLLTFTGFFAMNAQGMPTIYPSTSTSTMLGSIVNKTNSNLVADDSDGRIIFVMPPNSATSSVSGLHTLNANVGFCKELADMQVYSRKVSERIMELTTEERNTDEEVKEILQKLSKAKNELAQHVTLVKLDEILALDMRVETIEARIIELTDILMTCSQYCQNLREEIKELRVEKIETIKSRKVLAASHTKDLREYEKKKALVNSIQEDLQEREESWDKLRARLVSIRSNFHNMYSSFAQMEGARAGISFNSNWDNNINTLRELNPGFDFKKISTQNAVITTNIAELNSIPSGGAILGYQIGGTYSEGKLILPAYPENMSGNVRLSLLGTCPVLHPEAFDISFPNSSDQMKYGMTVAYEYPTAFLTEASVKYNMHKMYQKIVSSGSKGGFFKSKSWTSTEERTFFQDSFSVKWIEQDSGNSLSDEQKDNLEREMRNNVLGRLAAIGLPAYANAGLLVAPPTVPKTGATVISESLYRTCPGNYYCVGAAITMDVLQSIFGSSTTSASYTNVQDAFLEENWSRSKIVYKPWISAYN